MARPLVNGMDRLCERLLDLHAAQTDNPDLNLLRRCDVIASIPQTEVWLALPLGAGWAVAQAKLAAFEVEIGDYPDERVHLRGGDAARLARRWGREVPRAHPAYAAVETLAAGMGTVPRKHFVVIDVSKKVAGLPEPPHAVDAPDFESAALIAIQALVPLLSRTGRQQLQAMLAE